MNRRLIIVSNKVQPQAASEEVNGGSLAYALATAVRRTNGIWFGWSGEQTESFSGSISMARVDGVTTATIDLEAQDIEEYYHGYANRTLRPIFHYRVDLAEFERGFAGGYKRVNERFAQTLRPLIEPRDQVWVNDYHLIPLGANLRASGCDNPIGFFLHIPWPPMRLLLTLPSHGELVRSLFAYDVLGFQTEDSRAAFFDYVREHLDLVVSVEGVVSWEGRSTRTLVSPMGVDTRDFADRAKSPEALATVEAIKKSANDRAMIIGVDRLDYSKGVPERFLGYERLLAQRPEFHEKVFLLQIASPPRVEEQDYQTMRASLDTVSGRINGAFATPEWVPIRYVNRRFSRERLAGLYRFASVGLVTPLRDGMNLVAKEFVAAQDPADPGALVLSRFAGAAERLDAAILVNPHSAEDMADRLQQALSMPLEERRIRWESLMKTVREQDLEHWMGDFVSALHAASENGACPPQEPASSSSDN